MFVSTLRSKLSVPAMRAISTHTTQGLAAILERRPDDVVITFAKRTAMGRNRKGQFKDSPVDEMMQALYKVHSMAGANDRILIASCRQLSKRQGSTPEK